mmetsp:Transcript_46907/g.145255  ORF Transcript_46907/g.145255 Transcript_46907/m.145255 type:complete len:409 (-) Transcript_46907:276-1502(-)
MADAGERPEDGRRGVAPLRAPGRRAWRRAPALPAGAAGGRAGRSEQRQRLHDLARPVGVRDAGGLPAEGQLVPGRAGQAHEDRPRGQALQLLHAPQHDTHHRIGPHEVVDSGLAEQVVVHADRGGADQARLRRRDRHRLRIEGAFPTGAVHLHLEPRVALAEEPGALQLDELLALGDAFLRVVGAPHGHLRQEPIDLRVPAEGRLDEPARQDQAVLDNGEDGPWEHGEAPRLLHVLLAAGPRRDRQRPPLVRTDVVDDAVHVVGVLAVRAPVADALAEVARDVCELDLLAVVQVQKWQKRFVWASLGGATVARRAGVSSTRSCTPRNCRRRLPSLASATDQTPSPSVSSLSKCESKSYPDGLQSHISPLRPQSSVMPSENSTYFLTMLTLMMRVMPSASATNTRKTSV